MIGTLTRRENGDTETHRGKVLHDDGDRDWSHAATSQGMSGMVSHHQGIPLYPFRTEHGHADALILDIQPLEL